MLSPYITPADSTLADEIPFDKVWFQKFRSPHDLLVYNQNSPIAEKVQAYAQYLADLLNGRLDVCPRQKSSTFADIADATGACQDLVIYGAPCQSLLKRIIFGSADVKAVVQIPNSILITRCPRWPLRRILFVTRGHEMDGVAVSWVVALARSSRAAVTVLAVQPPLSAADSQALCRADWLASDTPLGRQLRQLAESMESWQTEGRLHFRSGPPGQQLKSEVTEGDPDLIIIASDPVNWWLRRLLGELVNPLLHWIDRPVLVAKPVMI